MLNYVTLWVNAAPYTLMVLILIMVIGLVSWALHLMQEAMDKNEFSLMLAGVLVSSAAAALVAVYLLVGDYMAYREGVVHYYNAYHQASELYEDLSYFELMEQD